MTAQFPAFVVDVGAGADYTIFPFGTFNTPSRIARAQAVAYADKYLRPKQISHAIYIVDSQEDFDAIIRRRNA